jgi:ubiquinone/menaquinone biosynthesis C-methylase UbiE
MAPDEMMGNRPPVNYDGIAAAYDRRYERYAYEGVRATLRRFLENGRSSILEVGCGTGHWLADVANRGVDRLFGLDLSLPMLQHARAAAPTARLVRGAADRLPWAHDSFDRVFCVNALHHFADPQAFIRECHRVLRPGGSLLTIGFDPHVGGDQWWVYDVFPSALHADRLRYPSTDRIRDWLTMAGFREPATKVAEHIVLELPFEAARQQGFVERDATSQLMLISVDDYQAGIERLAREQPVLRTDLRLYATTAYRHTGPR